MKRKVYGFVTVRTQSSRLPSKCLLPFGNTNVIRHIIRRSKAFGIMPILCTTTNKSDSILEKIAKSESVKIFRGSEKNKLKRWYDCARKFNINYFHTIDADDPFFCHKSIFSSMDLLINKKLDIVLPSKQSSAGLAIEGYSISYSFLRNIMSKLNSEKLDTEMFSKFLDLKKCKSKIFIEKYKNFKCRLTLDYIEDYYLLFSLCKILGNNVQRTKINKFMLNNPDFYKINWFRNKDWKAKQRKQLS
jgi:spore coat polysaccharide biosynthesis protein SpsF